MENFTSLQEDEGIFLEVIFFFNFERSKGRQKKKFPRRPTKNHPDVTRV